MLIHSKMLDDGTQAVGVPLKDDDFWRWDADFDYKSKGCAKLTPTGPKDRFSRLDQARAGRPAEEPGPPSGLTPAPAKA
ncbi:hypothetical protein [Streptomyces sp. NPDC048295]|uniref:hypothetical protein n=1 Tax=Streptomyces sp. NPDC048295 TaxID=3154617 RepID=UPI00342D156C